MNQQFTGSNNYFIAVGEANSAASAYETYVIVLIVIIIIIAMVMRRRSGKSKAKAKK